MLGWGIVLWFAGQYGLHAFSRLPRYSCALSLTLAVDDKGVLYDERDGKTSGVAAGLGENEARAAICCCERCQFSSSRTCTAETARFRLLVMI